MRAMLVIDMDVCDDVGEGKQALGLDLSPFKWFLLGLYRV
jgi:hypothetical protein